MAPRGLASKTCLLGDAGFALFLVPASGRWQRLEEEAVPASCLLGHSGGGEAASQLNILNIPGWIKQHLQAGSLQFPDLSSSHTSQGESSREGQGRGQVTQHDRHRAGAGTSSPTSTPNYACLFL